MTHQPAPGTPLREPGELIAILPYLIGYHPSNALVMVTVSGGDEEIHISGTLWTDLPPTEPYQQLAQHYAAVAHQQGALGVMLTIIGAAESDQHDQVPYQDLIRLLADGMALSGVRLLHTAWASATTPGGRWRCYFRPDECYGLVPAPEQTPAAVAAIAAGVVAFASQRELAELLRPDEDEAVLAQRAKQIDQRLTAGSHDSADDPTQGAGRALQTVQAAIRTIQDRSAPSELDLVELAVALTNPLVGAVCLGWVASEQAEAAEQLWLILTRAIPPPYRAEPACQLAAVAYLRGDRALANIAVEAAEQARPDYRLIYVLRLVLAFNLPPELVAASLTELGAQAHRAIQAG